MSLTRSEWVDIWKSTKEIERLSNHVLYNKNKMQLILKHIDFIQQKIQQIIGQME